jgi:hypothetical protein
MAIDPAQMAAAMPDMAAMQAMPQMPVPPEMAPMPGMPAIDPAAAAMGGGMGMPAPQGPPPAPPSLLIPDWLIEEIADQMLDREDELVTLAYEVMGPPRGTEGYSLDQQVAMYLAVPASLQNEDERDEAIYQMRAAKISEDEIMAAIYPLRPILFKMAGTSPDEVEAYARYIHPIAMRRLNTLPEVTSPFGSDEDEDDVSDDDPAYGSETDDELDDE